MEQLSGLLTRKNRDNQRLADSLQLARACLRQLKPCLVELRKEAAPEVLCSQLEDRLWRDEDSLKARLQALCREQAQAIEQAQPESLLIKEETIASLREYIRQL